MPRHSKKQQRRQQQKDTNRKKFKNASVRILNSNRERVSHTPHTNTHTPLLASPTPPYTRATLSYLNGVLQKVDLKGHLRQDQRQQDGRVLKLPDGVQIGRDSQLFEV